METFHFDLVLKSRKNFFKNVSTIIARITKGLKIKKKNKIS